jgi:hypothetical protein
MSLASTLIYYRDMNIIFEYTAPDSPQQNGKIERKVATLHEKMRAMLNEAQFTWPLRRNMWAYAALLVTKLDTILLCPEMGTTPHELFYGTQPVWINHLRTFGKIAIVKHPTKMQSKIKNEGFPGIYVGMQMIIKEKYMLLHHHQAQPEP